MRSGIAVSLKTVRGVSDCVWRNLGQLMFGLVLMCVSFCVHLCVCFLGDESESKHDVWVT